MTDFSKMQKKKKAIMTLGQVVKDTCILPHIKVDPPQHHSRGPADVYAWKLTFDPYIEVVSFALYEPRHEKTCLRFLHPR